MPTRLAYGLSALLIGVTALWGIQFSSAEWTDQSNTPVSIAAAPDWAGPTVMVAPLDAGIFGTVTVTATASDDRSDIGSVDLQYAPAAGGTWVSITTGCTAGAGPSPLTYSCQWDTTTAIDGDYLVRAVAADAATPTAFTSTSASVPTQVANNASVVLATVPSPTKGVVTLSGTLLNAGNGSRSITFEYAVAGSGTWVSTGCGTGTTSAYSCSWNTSALNGTYDVRAVGTRGGATFFDVQSAVLIDNTAPSASLTVPAGVLSSSIQLSVDASDTHTSVASVSIEYKRQGTGTWLVCGTPTSAPYACTLNTTSLQDGTYDFRAIATDAVGNTSPASTQTRDVNNTAGTVAISLPAPGATVSGNAVAVAATASSPRGVDSVSLQYRAGSTGTFTEICTDSSSPYACPAWDVSGLPNGAYQLRAVMTEASGGALVPSTPVDVSVNNALGSIAFTSPTAGSTVSGSVTLQAAVVPASGKTIQSVTFQGPGGDAQPLCAPVLAAPYTCSWLSTAVAYNATYQMRAVLTHTDGTKVTGTVVVKVDNVTGSTTSPTPTGNTRLTGVVSLSTTVTSNAPASSVRIIATRTRPTGPATLYVPCIAGAGVPPAAVTYACSWDTSAIANADYTLRSEATLANGTVVLSPLPESTVRVRNLRGQDVQGVPFNTAGKVSNKDALELTYSDQISLDSVITGWTSGPKTITATFTNSGSNDSISFSTPNLGTVQLGGDYVTGTVVVTGTLTASNVTVDGVLVTKLSLALGNPGNSSLVTSSSSGTMTWTPSSAVTALLGGSCSTLPVTETGAGDRDF